mgnify:FL=1
MTEYSSGVCNINPDESRKRFISGVIGVLAASVLSAIYIIQSLNDYFLLIVLLAAVFGFQGLIQSRNNFCVAHALKGTEKTGEETEKVEEEESNLKDKLFARKLVLKAVLYGAAFTLTVFLVKNTLI